MTLRRPQQKQIRSNRFLIPDYYLFASSHGSPQMLLQVHSSCVTLGCHLASKGLSFLFVLRSTFTLRVNYNRAGVLLRPEPSVSSFVS